MIVLMRMLRFNAGELEGMFEEVELRLVSLEDVIETQALQERQLDERFKLALYGERRKGHFENLQEKLEDDHLLMMHELEERERSVLQERQQTFSQVFQEDLKTYRAQGKIESELLLLLLELCFIASYGSQGLSSVVKSSGWISRTLTWKATRRNRRPSTSSWRTCLQIVRQRMLKSQ